MVHVSDEQLLAHLNWRYACKRFDPSQQIPPAQWQTIEEGFRLAPSSYSVQPWHFVVITDPAVKASLPAISFDQPQPKECSHVVVVAVRRDYTDSDVAHLVDRTAAVAGKTPEELAGFRKTVAADTSREPDREEVHRYLHRQTYIALGFGLSAAMMLGIDACPMEGIDNNAYDAQFKLANAGYHALCIACFGYRAALDPYLAKPKVRYDRTDVFTHIPPEQ